MKMDYRTGNRGVPRAGRKSQERKSENTNWRIFKAYHEDSSSATS